MSGKNYAFQSDPRNIDLKTFVSGTVSHLLRRPVGNADATWAANVLRKLRCNVDGITGDSAGTPWILKQQDRARVDAYQDRKAVFSKFGMNCPNKVDGVLRSAEREDGNSSTGACD